MSRLPIYSGDDTPEFSYPVPPPIRSGPPSVESANAKAAFQAVLARRAKAQAYRDTNREKLRAHSRQQAAKRRAKKTLHWCLLPRPDTPMPRVQPAKGDFWRELEVRRLKEQLANMT